MVTTHRAQKGGERTMGKPSWVGAAEKGGRGGGGGGGG